MVDRTVCDGKQRLERITLMKTTEFIPSNALEIGESIKQPALGCWSDGIITAFVPGGYLDLIDKYGGKTRVHSARILTLRQLSSGRVDWCQGGILPK